jgi:hypothetical protein
LLGMHEGVAGVTDERSGREFARAALAVSDEIRSRRGHGLERRYLILRAEGARW